MLEKKNIFKYERYIDPSETELRYLNQGHTLEYRG